MPGPQSGFASPGASRTPLRTPAAHPGPPSRTTTQSARVEGPCPHPVCPLCPLLAPSLPRGLPPLPAATAARPGKVEGQGGGRCALSCSGENLPSEMTQRLQGWLLGSPDSTFPGTSWLHSMPVGKKWVWPPTLPRASTLLTYGGTPQPRTQPQRTNPYHRSRDGQDTHVDGHGRTEGAVLAVQSRWSRTPTLDGGGRAFLGDKQLLLGHPPQAAPDCGVPSRRPPRRLCNPHGTNPPNREAMPAIERTRPGHPSQTHRPEASGQTKRWR